MRFKNKLKRISFHFSGSWEAVSENDDDDDDRREEGKVHDWDTHERLSSRVGCSFTIFVSRVPAVYPRSAYSIKRFVGAARRESNSIFFLSRACEISLLIVCGVSKWPLREALKNVTIFSGEPTLIALLMKSYDKQIQSVEFYGNDKLTQI